MQALELLCRGGPGRPVQSRHLSRNLEEVREATLMLCRSRVDAAAVMGGVWRLRNGSRSQGRPGRSELERKVWASPRWTWAWPPAGLEAGGPAGAGLVVVNLGTENGLERGAEG